jgi:hypothetical protein
MGPKFYTSALLHVLLPQISISQPLANRTSHGALEQISSKLRRMPAAGYCRPHKMYLLWVFLKMTLKGWLECWNSVARNARATFAFRFQNLSQTRSLHVAAANVATFWYHIVVRWTLLLVWDQTEEGHVEGGQAMSMLTVWTIPAVRL